VEHIIKDDTPTYIEIQYNWYSTPYLSGGGGELLRVSFEGEELM
jgi:hypothetical protein